MDLITFVNKNVGENNTFYIEKEDVKRTVRVCLVYFSNWLKGNGVINYGNLMEDMSTVEICRAQLWVWVKNRAYIKDKN